MSQPPISSPTQTSFEFSNGHEPWHEHYAVSASNQHAAQLVDTWPNWTDGIALLCGPAKSGKSHLATIWKQHAQAAKLSPNELEQLHASDILHACKHILLEDIETLTDETALFHLFNAVRNTPEASMLLTSNTPPQQLDFTLADLTSRLIACDAATLHLPDEALMQALFIKHFADRQLKVNQDVVDYLIQRCERSFQAASDIVAALDEMALMHGRNITIPFIASIKHDLPIA